MAAFYDKRQSGLFSEMECLPQTVYIQKPPMRGIRVANFCAEFHQLYVKMVKSLQLLKRR